MSSAVGRRLAKLEGSLPPREAVLAWLAEAQRAPGLVAHVQTLIELPVGAAPLSVIGMQVEAAVRAATKGQSRVMVEAAVRRALGDAAFLFALVLGLNGQALEIARLEGLRATAVFHWLRSLGDGRPAEGTAAWAQCGAAVVGLTTVVAVEAAARAELERRYVGGHDVLFEDATTAWAAFVDLVERLAGLADAITGVRTTRNHLVGSPETAESLEELVTERVARLADDARICAYEILGDRPRVVRILERQLRS